MDIRNMTESGSKEGPGYYLFSVNKQSYFGKDDRESRWIFNRYFLVALRIILAVVFIYAGIQKVGKPLAFSDEIRMYGILDFEPCLSIVAIVLPWIEIFCGISLITGVFLRGTALILIILNAIFIIFVSIRTVESMQSGGIKLMEVYFDCGCGFGGTYAWKKILEDLSFMLAALILLVAPVHRYVFNPVRRER